MSEQEFHPGSVPVAVAARVYGKDASLLYEETGFLWKGEKR